MRAIAGQADVVIVFGSTNSRLVQVAQRCGTQAYLAKDLSQIHLAWIAEATAVGLTSGASAPSALLHDAVDALSGLDSVTVHESPTAIETVRFALPGPLRTKPTD